MSGSDKRKLLVIGKSKQPRGFPSNHTKLPVMYRHSANAWMTSNIFTEYMYLQALFVCKAAQFFYLSIIAQPILQSKALYLSIRLEFLPPNTTATLQPCDQGIIRNLKCHYRSALNRLIISELDADDIKSATDIAQSITTMRAIYLMFDAWANVSQNSH
ncbi:tigger transposable element-derived protein [Elysia marginata]|uniref:Tigger transposable element-derived protein n=1 Tax=Elysia marginata TaxID=1093978 RepID=A0AAV4JQD1_9GAST|nr:tigger transposable element-derived protein [Elysia marginata]